METGNIYDKFKNLEIALDNGLSLLTKTYVICNKKEILNIIFEIKESLPVELLEAEQRIIHSGENGYCLFNAYVVLPHDKMCEIIDNIYADLPVNIQIARQMFKS